MKTWLLVFALLIVIPAVFALELPPGLVKLGEYQLQLAGSITFLVALLAGAVTFTSPCGFVVLPVFFTYLFKERKRAVLMTGVFALGMMLAFVLLGLLAGSAGAFINEYKMPFAFVSGFVLVAFGIMLLFNLGFSFLHFKLNHSKGKSAFGVGLMGFFFAIGWTPCLGPVLTGIMILAANTGTALKGALMLGTYAVGVTIPLLIIAAFSDRFDWANSSLLRGKHITFRLFGKQVHTHTYNIIGGIILIALGGLMIAQSGTFFFMNKLPQYLPWTMDLFIGANERLTASSLLTSWWGNIIGILFIGALAWFIIRAARNKDKALREV